MNKFEIEKGKNLVNPAYYGQTRTCRVCKNNYNLHKDMTSLYIFIHKTKTGYTNYTKTNYAWVCSDICCEMFILKEM